MYLTILRNRLLSLPGIHLLQQDYCVSTPTTQSLLGEFDNPKWLIS